MDKSEESYKICSAFGIKYNLYPLRINKYKFYMIDLTKKMNLIFNDYND